MKCIYAQARRSDWIRKHLLHYFIRPPASLRLGGVKVCLADSYLRTVSFFLFFLLRNLHRNTRHCCRVSIGKPCAGRSQNLKPEGDFSMQTHETQADLLLVCEPPESVLLQLSRTYFLGMKAIAQASLLSLAGGRFGPNCRYRSSDPGRTLDQDLPSSCLRMQPDCLSQYSSSAPCQHNYVAAPTSIPSFFFFSH